MKLGLHTMFVGEIMDIKAEEYVLDENGNPDIERIKPVIYGTGNKSYYSIGRNLGKAFISAKCPEPFKIDIIFTAGLFQGQDHAGVSCSG